MELLTCENFGSMSQMDGRKHLSLTSSTCSNTSSDDPSLSLSDKINGIQSVRDMIHQREMMARKAGIAMTRQSVMLTCCDPCPTTMEIKDKVKSMVQQFESKTFLTLAPQEEKVRDVRQEHIPRYYNGISMATSKNPLSAKNEEAMNRSIQVERGIRQLNAFAYSKNLQSGHEKQANAMYLNGNEARSQSTDSGNIPDLDIDMYKNNMFFDSDSAKVSRCLQQDKQVASSSYQILNRQAVNEQSPTNNTQNIFIQHEHSPGFIITNSKINTSVVQFYPENLHSPQITEIPENFTKTCENSYKLSNTGTENLEGPITVYGCMENSGLQQETFDSFVLIPADDKEFKNAFSEISKQAEIATITRPSSLGYIISPKHLREDECNKLACPLFQTPSVQVNNKETLPKTSSFDPLMPVSFSVNQTKETLMPPPTLSDFFNPNVSQINTEQKTSENCSHHECISTQWILDELDAICPELELNPDPNETCSVLKLMEVFENIKKIVSSLRDEGKNTAKLFEENRTTMKSIKKQAKELETKYSRLHSKSVCDNLRLVELTEQCHEVEQVKELLKVRMLHFHEQLPNTDCLSADVPLPELLTAVLGGESQIAETKFEKQIAEMQRDLSLLHKDSDVHNKYDYICHQGEEIQYLASIVECERKELKLLKEEIAILEDKIESQSAELNYSMKEKNLLQKELKLAHQNIFHLEKMTTKKSRNFEQDDPSHIAEIQKLNCDLINQENELEQQTRVISLFEVLIDAIREVLVQQKYYIAVIPGVNKLLKMIDGDLSPSTVILELGPWS